MYLNYLWNFIPSSKNRFLLQPVECFVSGVCIESSWCSLLFSNLSDNNILIYKFSFVIYNIINAIRQESKFLT